MNYAAKFSGNLLSRHKPSIPLRKRSLSYFTCMWLCFLIEGTAHGQDFAGVWPIFYAAQSRDFCKASFQNFIIYYVSFQCFRFFDGSRLLAKCFSYFMFLLKLLYKSLESFLALKFSLDVFYFLFLLLPIVLI